MKKKKVCILIDDLTVGGAQRAVVNLANELAQRGYMVHLISPYVVERFDLNKDNIHLFKLEYNRGVFDLLAKALANSKISWRLKWMLRTWWRSFLVTPLEIFKFSYNLLNRYKIKALKELIQKKGPYVAFFSNMFETDFLTIGSQLPNHYCVIHRDMQESFGFVWVRAWWNTGIFKQLRNFLRISRARSFYSGQNIITVSEELQGRTLGLGIRPKSIQHIYNILDFTKVRKEAEAYNPPEDDYIVYVGRESREKDTPTLLQAYAKSGIKQKLVMLGVSHEATNNLAQNLGIADKLVLRGCLANPYPYIKNAKALVLSSRVEGLPYVMVEALVLGTPIVSTDCYTGPKEILTDELAEFLSPVGDVDALARNLVKVIARPPKIQDKHLAKFSLEENIGKYISLIEQG